MIKVLIVEDSSVTKELLLYILSSEPDIQVIGVASNGEEAVEMVKAKKPDVVTMDINMPKMDGLEAIRHIMSANPVPIIIVSSNWESENVEATFKAVEVGAVAFVEKPWGITHPSYHETANKLLEAIRLMSEVKVIKRWFRPNDSVKKTDNFLNSDKQPGDIKIVGIGVSTGGPVILQKMFEKISKGFPVPIVVVQHITVGFLSGFVEWLNHTSNLPVHIATDNTELKPGNIYFAAEKCQLKINKNYKLVLTDDEEENSIKPSVSYLFRSIAEVYGNQSIGILLTGMGKDGANELLMMKNNGSVTIVQDKETSIVHGMPGEAIKIGAAKYILSPDKIIDLVEKLVRN